MSPLKKKKVSRKACNLVTDVHQRRQLALISEVALPHSSASWECGASPACDGVSKGRSKRRPPSAGGVRYFSCFLQVRHASLGRRWLRKAHLVQIDTLEVGTQVNLPEDSSRWEGDALKLKVQSCFVNAGQAIGHVDLKTELHLPPATITGGRRLILKRLYKHS